MAEVIEKHIQNLHDGTIHKKQHIEQFQLVEADLWATYWRAIKTAETSLKKYRREHDMHSFQWEMSYRETLQSILGLQTGKPRLPNAIEHRQKMIVRKAIAQRKKGDSIKDALKNRDLAMLQRVLKLKPEYQGLNHPLQQNQIIRSPNARLAPHSKQAIKVLEEFEARTGKNAFIRYPRKLLQSKRNPHG